MLKRPAVKDAQFLTDAEGKRTAVLLDLRTYERLREAEEELADIETCDALRDRAAAEIAAGQSSTLTTIKAQRMPKKA